MDIEITLNNYYSKEEIEIIFHTNFGARIKGINLRLWNGTTPYIIIFSRSTGPYEDNISGDFFYYVGEGLEGDQKLTAANKALINANSEKRTIYGFRQEASRDKWKYIGILEVLNYDYVLKNGRKVYEYKLRQSEIEDNKVIEEEQDKIEQISKIPEPNLEGVRKLSKSNFIKKIRDEAFRRKIKEIYNDKCVVCKKQRYTNSRYPEVQAAHIYPVEKNGSDDLRNGISLCRLHHWAFDGGLFTIADDLTIIVSKKILNKPDYDEITNYDKNIILLPSNELYKPISIFLKQHRLIHGFE